MCFPYYDPVSQKGVIGVTPAFFKFCEKNDIQMISDSLGKRKKTWFLGSKMVTFYNATSLFGVHISLFAKPVCAGLYGKTHNF